MNGLVRVSPCLKSVGVVSNSTLFVSTVGTGTVDKINYSSGIRDFCFYTKDGDSKSSVAIVGDDKSLFLPAEDCSTSFHKKLTCVCFSPENNSFFIGDRFGDVFSYRSKESSELLGHLSIITGISFANDFLVTADADAKIRVSKYPNTFTVQSFCLGHTGFISSLVCVPEHSRLFSSSADGTIRIWDMITGEQLDIISSLDGSPIVSMCMGSNTVYFIAGNKVYSSDIENGVFVHDTISECSNVQVDTPLYLEFSQSLLWIVGVSPKISVVGLKGAVPPQRILECVDSIAVEINAIDHLSSPVQSLANEIRHAYETGRKEISKKSRK